MKRKGMLLSVLSMTGYPLQETTNFLNSNNKDSPPKKQKIIETCWKICRQEENGNKCASVKDVHKPCLYFCIDCILGFHMVVDSFSAYDLSLRKLVKPVVEGFSRIAYVPADSSSMCSLSFESTVGHITPSKLFVDIAWELFLCRPLLDAEFSIGVSMMEVSELSGVQNLLSTDFDSDPKEEWCDDLGDLLCLLVTAQQNFTFEKPFSGKHLIFRFNVSVKNKMISTLDVVFLAESHFSSAEMVPQHIRNLIELGGKALETSPYGHSKNEVFTVLCQMGATLKTIMKKRDLDSTNKTSLTFRNPLNMLSNLKPIVETREKQDYRLTWNKELKAALCKALPNLRTIKTERNEDHDKIVALDENIISLEPIGQEEMMLFEQEYDSSTCLFHDTFVGKSETNDSFPLFENYSSPSFGQRIDATEGASWLQLIAAQKCEANSEWEKITDGDKSRGETRQAICFNLLEETKQEEGNHDKNVVFGMLYEFDKDYVDPLTPLVLRNNHIAKGSSRKRSTTKLHKFINTGFLSC